MRITLLILLFYSIAAEASNLTSSTINVFSIGAGQIEVELGNIFFCSADSISSEDSVLVTSACGDSLWMNLVGSHTSFASITWCEIQDCTGNTPRGFTRYSYVDSLLLPSNCVDWKVHYFGRARMGAANLQNGQSQYVYTTFTRDQNAFGPEFIFSIVKNGEPTRIPVRAPDFGGDSVITEIVPALTSENTLATYVSGNDFASPFDSSFLTEGFLNMRHDSVEYIVLAVKNTQYLNGSVVSEVHSEMVVFVSDIDYNSHGPQWLSPGLTPLLSNITSVDSLTVHVNPGDTLAFEMQFADSNLEDSLFLLGGPSEGMFYDTSGINPLHIVVYGTAPLRDTTLAVFFIISDSSCSDKSFYGAYFIKVGTGVSTGPEILENEMVIFPNPASNVVFVKGVLDPTNYSLYDMSGKMLLHGLISNSHGIPLDGVKGGIYILQVEESRFKLLVE